MHFVLSATFGATDTTRASLPFIFAASALESGDTVTIMLFHDAVTIAKRGAAELMVPFGPPQRFKEVFSHDNAEIIVCKPCAEVRGLDEAHLADNCKMGGMNDFHARAAQQDSKVVAF